MSRRVNTLIERKVGQKVALQRYLFEARKGPFARISEQRRTAIIEGMNTEVAADQRVLFVASCDKYEHRSRYGERPVDRYLPADLYLMLFTFLLERFCRFLEERDAQGALVIETRGRSEDARLNRRFAEMLDEGTQYFEPWRFNDRISPTLRLAKKTERVGGLQIADWILWPLAKRLAGSFDYESDWEVMRSKFWVGVNPHMPGQVGLKTWPRSTGREWLRYPREAQ